MECAPYGKEKSYFDSLQNQLQYEGVYELTGEFWRVRRLRQDAFDCPSFVAAARQYPFEELSDFAWWRVCTEEPSKKEKRKVPEVIMKVSTRRGKREPKFAPAIEAFPSAWWKKGSPVAYLALRWYLNSWPIRLSLARHAVADKDDVTWKYDQVAPFLQMKDKDFGANESVNLRDVLRALREHILDEDAVSDEKLNPNVNGCCGLRLSPEGNAASGSET